MSKNSDLFSEVLNSFPLCRSNRIDLEEDTGKERNSKGKV